jgi:hypothetical protein
MDGGGAGLFRWQEPVEGVVDEIGAGGDEPGEVKIGGFRDLLDFALSGHGAVFLVKAMGLGKVFWKFNIAFPRRTGIVIGSIN